MLSSVTMQSISKAEIKDLLSHAFKTQYRVQDRDKKSESVMEKVVDLFRLDYQADILSNLGGELGSNYPSRMVLLSAAPAAGVSPAAIDSARLHRLALVARMARCRGRFPISVILYRGRHICRSSTLSVGAEMYPRHYFHSIFGGRPAGDGGPASPPATDADAPDAEPERPPAPSPPPPPESSTQLFDRLRHMDMTLLRLFSVHTIADLMVENKKVKFGVYVSSSEKVDKQERYADFELLSLPYPGCEFFQQYCQHGYQDTGLMFDWNQSYIDAEVVLPPPLQDRPEVPWHLYRTWDIVQLTQNYLRLLLHCLHASQDGLLIHCISGWDRTPLFVCLLRLTLWADGLIHQALDASQILYLTLAYDWFLFGHNLEDRVAKDEEIMHFAFNFLTHIESDEFSASHFGEPSPSGLQRTESDVHLVGGVLLEGLETDASSIHSSSSSTSDCATTTLLAGGGSGEAWPFVDQQTSLEASLSELELSSSSSCSSGRPRAERRRGGRRRRRDDPEAPSAASAAAAAPPPPPPVVGSYQTVELRPADCSPSPSPAARRRAERKVRLLERQGSGSLESLPEQRDWVSRPELRPCRSEAGSFSGGSYHEPRTSPVTVPTGAGGSRARHESCGSVGSWQLITGSGSVNGSGSHGSSTHSRSSYNSMGHEFTESTTTLIDESGEQSTEQQPETRRSSRLRAVRCLFLQSYSSAVGLKTGPLSQRTTGAPAGFSIVPAIVSSLAGRVGMLMT
ncbi:Myotubularin-related protein 14 [Amphibalanus amphitrite]|uniref:Myotubularin-related protein 14 n=1 Tax=Amphibalanus amphitrite TaxID=1232801 RepID=A0A6A4UWH1_AMPAM|nr:Myotubularin-related protein 14 [Amphibalanus amphitrite]